VAPSGSFCPLETSTKDGAKTRENYRDYYDNRRWLDEIDGDSAALIRATTDLSGLERYGYEPI